MKISLQHGFGDGRDEEIDPESDSIPPMFVQPFVENAIEHGIADLDKKGFITVSFSKNEEHVEILVTDNGRGLSQKKNADHKSLSSTIIQERMDLFNRSLKRKIQLAVNEIKNQRGEIEGTQVELKVPFDYS